MTKAIKIIPLLMLSLACGFSTAGDKALTNTWSSPHVTFRCTDINDVHWTSGFWADRFEACAHTMVPTMFELLSDSKTCPAYDNFLIAAGKKEGRHHGAKWFDGDFYKWLETAAYVYGINRDPALDKQMDDIIALIAQTQRADGYIHSPVVIQERKQDAATSEFQERLDFETYNMGHLMTTACVHYRATGKTSLLDVARKATDYLYNLYKASPQIVANNAICPSHYMGVVEMYRVTRDPRYLELAKGLINIRHLVTQGTDHNQDRIPFSKQTEAVGHAVRANYLYAGVADIYAEAGDRSLLKTLEILWNDVTYRKLYITGATGALYDGASPDGSKNHGAIGMVHQAYGRAYQLPNVTAYNESCATIGYALWNWRMLTITAQARYADQLEHVLYNGVLSTISLDGTKFFYRNTLRQVDDLPFELRWSDQRVPYISCFCCPPNIIRTIAEVSSYAYTLTDRGVWVNLYGSNTLNTNMPDGSVIKLTQDTDYPWGGTIGFSIDQCPTGPWSLFLRIPSWATEARIRINGQAMSHVIQPGQYADIHRQWSQGDNIELVLPMQPFLIQAHPLVEEARNQVAVQRGPILYCLESSDLPDGVDINDIALSPATQFKTHYNSDFLGGISVLQASAQHRPSKKWTTLYRKLSPDTPRPVEVNLVPYYAWGNRGKSEMTVWMPLTHGQANPDSASPHIIWKPAQFNPQSPGLSFSGHPKIIDSPYGKAAWFNGQDDAFFLAQNPLADLRSFTVEVIFQPDTGGARAQRFLHMGEVSADRMLLETRLTENGLWYLDSFIKSGSSGKALIDPTLLHALDQWYHLALVVDDGDMKSYVNGRLELQGHVDFSPIVSGQSSVGVRRNKVDWFAGAIYSIRVTPQALTPEAFILQ